MFLNRCRVHVRSSLLNDNANFLVRYVQTASNNNVKTQSVTQPTVTTTTTTSTWTRTSRRAGLVGIKMGMTHTWDSWGTRVPLTALHIRDNQIVKQCTEEKEGKSSLQVGVFDHPKAFRLKKSVRGQFEKAGVPAKRRIVEFPVTADALIPVGTKLHVNHFVPGQFVDVMSTSIGKGFAGVMKRHGMSGQPRAHGQTKCHRKMGASGGGTNPGRVWPGKRMAGHMGMRKTMTFNLQVYKIDTRWDVLYLKGCVPGSDNVYVEISDGRRKNFVTPPPFPTAELDPAPGIYIAPKPVSDPGEVVIGY